MLTGDEIREGQRKWREAHPNYNKNYYQQHKKKERTLIIVRIKNLFKGGRK
jgi:hypothetical protein